MQQANILIFRVGLDEKKLSTINSHSWRLNFPKQRDLVVFYFHKDICFFFSQGSVRILRHALGGTWVDSQYEEEKKFII